MSRKIPCPQCGHLCARGGGMYWHVKTVHEGVPIGGGKQVHPRGRKTFRALPLSAMKKIALAEKHKLLL